MQIIPCAVFRVFTPAMVSLYPRASERVYVKYLGFLIGNMFYYDGDVRSVLFQMMRFMILDHYIKMPPRSHF